MKLLLVEDDPMLGESLQKALRKTGYSVDWVQDGADVEPCLKDQDYALVILDLGLPNKSGISILEDIPKMVRAFTPGMEIPSAHIVKYHLDKLRSRYSYS